MYVPIYQNPSLDGWPGNSLHRQTHHNINSDKSLEFPFACLTCILAVTAAAAGSVGVEEVGGGPGAGEEDKVARKQDDGNDEDASLEQVGACLLWMFRMCKREMQDINWSSSK